MTPKLKVLAVPDLHCPFEHKDALAFLTAVKKKHAPDVVVCLGDELDEHALSDYDSDPDGLSAGDELRRGIEHLRPFYDLFPDVKVCTSNHTSRIYRKAFSSGIPRAYLKEYRDWMQAPKGWSWSDYYTIDGVVYYHGEGVNGPEGALKAAAANACPTVIGHLHSDAGIRFMSTAAALVWGLNCGWLGDRRAYAMAYSKHSLKRGILGCGIINRGAPFFLPMWLDRAGRWTGVL